MEKIPKVEQIHTTVLRLAPTDKIQLAKLMHFLSESGLNVEDVNNRINKEEGRVISTELKLNDAYQKVKEVLESDEEYKHLAKSLMGSV